MNSPDSAIRLDFSVYLAGFSVICLLLACEGCRHAPAGKSELVSDDDREFYREMATQIELSTEPIQQASYETTASATYTAPEHLPPLPLPDAQSPAPLPEIDQEAIWRLTLAEAIHVALENNQIIRINDQFLSSSNLLFGDLPLVDSKFDPQIQATRTVGQRGAEAARSDFIPTLVTEYTWLNDERIQNNLLTDGIQPGGVLDQDFGRFRVGVENYLKTGGRVAVEHNVNFDRNNVPTPPRLFSSAYDGDLALTFNQPLWGGAGTHFTEIAGPVDLISTRFPSTDQGIAIASINDRVSSTETQVVLRQLVKDVSDVFWDLHLAHERYRIQQRIRSASERLWETARVKLEQGLGGGAADVAQAQESFLAADAQVTAIRAEISLAENRLRRLLGIGLNDGRVIRPFVLNDSTDFSEDWYGSLQTAFSNRLELQSTKLAVRSLKLQLSAAKGLIKPRLDLISDFSLNGFGDRLAQDSDNPALPESFYNNLSQFDQVGWSIGGQFSMPLDRQVYRSLQRNVELRLMKANALLAAQELEIQHELQHAFQSALKWSQLANKNLQRMQAAAAQVDALEASRPTGKVSIDRLVRAQQTLGAAETEYLQAIAEFQKALNEIRFRRGTLLEENRLFVEE